MPNGERTARFIEPTLLVRTDKLPEGAARRYEVKFDGYRALAIKSDGEVRLRSRNDKDFTRRYSGVVAALAELPDETVIDGEVVALDLTGRPVFSLLQNGGTNVHFYVFDVLMLSGKDTFAGLGVGIGSGFIDVSSIRRGSRRPRPLPYQPTVRGATRRPRPRTWPKRRRIYGSALRRVFLLDRCAWWTVVDRPVSL